MISVLLNTKNHLGNLKWGCAYGVLTNWILLRPTEKVDLGGYDSTSRSPQLVDQSSPDFFRRTPEKLG